MPEKGQDTVREKNAMGHALDIVSNNNAPPNKRNDKASRGQGYTGNLTAFSHSDGVDSAERASSAMARFTAMQPTVENSRQLSAQMADDHYPPSATWEGRSSSERGKFSWFQQLQPTQKRNLTAAVIGSLTVGALIGSIWSSSNEQDNADVESLTVEVDRSTRPNQSAVIRNTANGINNANGIGDSSSSIETRSASVIGENSSLPPESTPIYRALESQVKGYQEEIEWLNDQNATLTEKVGMLNSETLKLNKELLGLELELAQSQPTVETRTIYNFVNVPIGGGDASANNVQSYSEPVVYEDNSSYAEDEFLPNGNLEYREAYGYPEDPEPVYDPETGLYLSPEMLGDGQRFYDDQRPNDDQQPYDTQQFDSGAQYIEQNTQVIYPPVAPDSY